MPKDLFSSHAQAYAQYRPGYPAELFDYILERVPAKRKAWDCATGNGQAARVLADHFDKVEASDISQAQISQAFQKENIGYHVCPAEQTPFAADSFDLITVATAYHWLDWKKFKAEATRVARPGAVVAIWAYHLLLPEDPALQKLVRHLYHDIVGPYWDPERRFVDESYATVSFDFDPLPSKNFQTELLWTLEQFTGYLGSWSAVQHYIAKHHASPIDLVAPQLQKAWRPGEYKTVRFPVFLRLGRIGK